MTHTYLRTETLPLAALEPFPGNARRGDIPRIRQSLRRNRQYKSLTVREHGRGDGVRYTVLTGNNTREAMILEGWTEARCEIIRCTTAEARRINATDNATADHASYDEQLHAQQIADLQGDYDGSGYTPEEAAKLLAIGDDDDWPGDPDDGDGDGRRGGAPAWGVIISCSTEDEQARLLERLLGEGLNVRALTGS